MGQAASSELRAAQSTITALTKDLAAARSTLAATEATVQQAKSEAVVRGGNSFAQINCGACFFCCDRFRALLLNPASS